MATTLAMKLGLFTARRNETRAASEQAAFEVLAGECWDQLWRYAYRTTGDRDDAEDLLSETLMEGFRGFHQFRGETSFCRWMYRIMTTTRIDMMRRARRRRTDSLETLISHDPEEQATWDIPDVDADPEKRVIGPMLSEEVQCALNALPEEFRAVVALADMEQMDYADISRVLKIPIGTVRSRLHRARLLLRKSLASYVER